MNKQVNTARVIHAAKWSSLTEIAAKIIMPITNMYLARILAPEAFGVIATVTMIFSFADMFTSAGFEKYLVQYEFKDDKEKYQCANVAFWSNLGLSCALWGVIALFSNQIAGFVGNPGLGNVITVACMQLPLTSFSSIQTALYERNFSFKTLFAARIVTVSAPFAVTLPLALSGFGYWSLIYGTIVSQLCNAVILTACSKWKPKWYYSIQVLKKMLSFSIWTLAEHISIWFSIWADIFIVGGAFTAYYLGLYKTSLSMVNALLAVVTAAITPVLYSALSRFQTDDGAFKNIFYKAQKSAAYVLFPLGLGLFIYSDLATYIMLGDQWGEASFIIGIWGITTVIKIVLSDLNSECFRAKGRPKLSLLIQAIHLAFLIVALMIALGFGFEALVYVRAFIRFELVLSSLIAMEAVLHIPVKAMFRHIIKPAVFTAVAGLVALGFRQVSNHLVWNIISMLLCLLVYCILVRIFAKDDIRPILKGFAGTRKLGGIFRQNAIKAQNKQL